MKCFPRCFYMIIVVFLCRVTPYAAEYTVSSASDIAAIENSVQPGDTITMTDGDWNNQVIELDFSGSAGDTILVRAQTPGAVIIKGVSCMEIGGSYIKVDGITFTDGYTPDADDIILNSAVER